MRISEVLVIDDDSVFLTQITKVISQLGYSVQTENNSAEALTKVMQNKFDVILVDIKMPGIDGIELIRQILDYDNSIPILVVSGQSTINIAVEAMKLGAFDFIEKPVNKRTLEIPLRNAAKVRELQVINNSLKNELLSSTRLIGVSPQIKSIISQVEIAAGTDAKVLITGETGTGKEIIARAIHLNSSRRDQAYIKVNCAAIPADLLESELFGHAKGSFTGAVQDKPGKFQAANNGTLFLDEIGDMNIILQAKILRVLEENEIEVVGETQPRKVNIRIIAATNKDLEKEIEAGNFRRDLFYRLNLIRIHITPLRERKCDIRPLAYFYLHEFSEIYNKKITGITERAITILEKHDYPGNVRELKSILEKLVIFSIENQIDLEDVSRVFKNHYGIQSDINMDPTKDLRTAKLEFEREYIIKILSQNNGKIIETAEVLGMDRSNLFKKMKQLGIDKTELN